MSAPGPSKSNDTRQKQKYYKFNRGGGADRGGGGGRGRGRGKILPGGAGGPSFTAEDGRVVNPLGRYREETALLGLSAPGITVTTVQFKERSAERELIEYLETIADELEEMEPSTIVPVVDASDDVEQQLKQELEGMSTGKSTRFRLCQHQTPCVIYIGVLAPLDPIKLVYRIMEKVESSGQSPFKFVKRLVPISGISGATLHQAGELAKSLVPGGFETPDNRPLKPNSRNSNKLERLELIKKVADEVMALPQGHTVDLDNPDRTILVEVDKNSLGMSIVEHYDRFKKFNPSSIAEALAKSKAEQPATEAPRQKVPGQASAQNNANRAARAAALNASVGLGGEKRKADAVDVEGDVAMDEMAGESGKGSKVQRLA